MSLIGNRISGYLHNERFSKSNEEKSTAFQNMTWSLIIHKNTITNWSTVLQTSPQSLCFYPSFPFSWRQDTFAILQSYVHHLVYVIPIVVCFHKWFNKFRLSKNLLTNIFFRWNLCFSIYLVPWRRELLVSLFQLL